MNNGLTKLQIEKMKVSRKTTIDLILQTNPHPDIQSHENINPHGYYHGSDGEWRWKWFDDAYEKTVMTNERLFDLWQYIIHYTGDNST